MSADCALHGFSECRFQAPALSGHVPHRWGSVVLDFLHYDSGLIRVFVSGRVNERIWFRNC